MWSQSTQSLTQRLDFASKTLLFFQSFLKLRMIKQSFKVGVRLSLRSSKNHLPILSAQTLKRLSVRDNLATSLKATHFLDDMVQLSPSVTIFFDQFSNLLVFFVFSHTKHGTRISD
jgi:hypothetical protein